MPPRFVINNNLRTIEAKLRNQYRLIYDPAEVERRQTDHSHQIELTAASERIGDIVVSSGYYATEH